MKHSEFRKDIISGEWVLFVPGRIKKPSDFKKKTEERSITPISQCLFEDPFKNVDEEIILEYTRKKNGNTERDWDLLVLKNKYPAVAHFYKKTKEKKSFFSESVFGAGHHDLVITRDHKKNFVHISKKQAFQVFSAFRDRYLMLFADTNVEYISMFHNWGRRAGASIFHPHYQILAIPVIPTDISRALLGSRSYFQEHGRCVYCEIVKAEKKAMKRIVFENEYAIAICPYVSRYEFEINIFPKCHRAYFENTLDDELEGVVEALRYVLRKVEKNLGDPDYNFFLHVAPTTNKIRYKKSFHWHIEVRPALGTSGGFEYDTGMEINVVDPDIAAKTLKR